MKKSANYICDKRLGHTSPEAGVLSFTQKCYLSKHLKIKKPSMLGK